MVLEDGDVTAEGRFCGSWPVLTPERYPEGRDSDFGSDAERTAGAAEEFDLSSEPAPEAVPLVAYTGLLLYISPERFELIPSVMPERR